MIAGKAVVGEEDGGIDELVPVLQLRLFHCYQHPPLQKGAEPNQEFRSARLVYNVSISGEAALATKVHPYK